MSPTLTAIALTTTLLTSTLHPTITHAPFPHKPLNPTEEASHTPRTSWPLIIGFFIALVICASLSGIYILSIHVRVCMKRHGARHARETRTQRTRRASLALSDDTDTEDLEMRDLAVVNAAYHVEMRGDRWWMGQYEGGQYESARADQGVLTGDDRRRLRRGRRAIGLRRSGSVATLPKYEVRDSGLLRVPGYEERERGVAGGDEREAEGFPGGNAEDEIGRNIGGRDEESEAVQLQPLPRVARRNT